MHAPDAVQGRAFDPLLVQAEKVLAQRQARATLIDPDLLGEPGWDILLCAFIACRKGEKCHKDAIARQVGVSTLTASRWMNLLEDRHMIESQYGAVALTDEGEAKLASLFSAQMKELMREFGTFQASAGE